MLNPHKPNQFERIQYYSSQEIALEALGNDLGRTVFLEDYGHRGNDWALRYSWFFTWSETLGQKIYFFPPTEGQYWEEKAEEGQFPSTKIDTCDLTTLAFKGLKGQQYYPQMALGYSFESFIGLYEGGDYVYRYFEKHYDLMPFGGKEVNENDLVLDEEKFFSLPFLRERESRKDSKWFYVPIYQMLFYFNFSAKYSEYYFLPNAHLWSFRAQMWLHGLSKGRRLDYNELFEGFSQGEVESIQVALDRMLEKR